MLLASGTYSVYFSPSKSIVDFFNFVIVPLVRIVNVPLSFSVVGLPSAICGALKINWSSPPPFLLSKKAALVSSEVH